MLHLVDVNLRFRVYDKNSGKDVTNDYGDSEFIITSKGELKQVCSSIVIAPPENLDVRIIMDIVVRDAT